MQQGHSVEKRLLNETEAAHYLGTSAGYLRKSRSCGLSHAPSYVKIGRKVAYDLADLDEFILAHKHRCGDNSRRLASEGAAHE